MSRPALGLALGGGAVLGFAHLGLLEALEEDGIRPDLLSGTSAGALVAALFAFGTAPRRIQELLVPLTWRKVSDFSRTSLGLLSNASIGRMLAEELGDVDIRDSPVPLAIIAADIHTGEAVFLRDGPLGDAVRASAAIPGLYAPVPIGGRLLVDGGIVENVPVRPLQEMGADVIVAATLGEALDFQPVRTLVGVLTNAFLIAVNTATRLDLKAGVDVLVEPKLEVYNHWDLRQREQLIERGRDAGREARPRIRAAIEAATAGG